MMLVEYQSGLIKYNKKQGNTNWGDWNSCTCCTQGVCMSLFFYHQHPETRTGTQYTAMPTAGIGDCGFVA